MTKSIEGIRYIDDCEVGYFRKKRGRGFSYFDEDGERIKDKEVIGRIKAMVIPPMWDDVWICKRQDGHLQATGRDEKGRKQYIYHSDWTAYRQQMKFDKMVDFVHALPEVRRRTAADLRKRSWTKEKVLALIVKVLDECGIRIGNDYYRATNSTFGLTTLRRKHMDIEGKQLTFEYKAKSNKYRSVELSDKRLVKLIRQCSELPGYEVFRYIDEDGKSQTIDSSDVNAYIQEIAGEKFSSKDFRTWTANRLAVDYYSEVLEEVEEGSRKKLEPTLVKKVAGSLGNTMSVCRSYYLHPKIREAAESKSIPSLESITTSDLEKFDNLLEEEEIVAYRLIK